MGTRNTIGDYTFNYVLGHGNFGIVFKGNHAQTSQPVAVKRIGKHEDIYPHEKSRTFEMLKDIRHGNILWLIDFLEDANYMYVISEYCNGGDLGDHLRLSAERKLPEKTIALLLTQIATGLKYLLTEKNIIHRGVKPQNILLSYFGSVLCGMEIQPEKVLFKLSDFGFARHLLPGGYASIFCGNLIYKAPEIFTSHRLQYDWRADVWSLGVVVYKCLAGRLPFPLSPPTMNALTKLYEEKIPEPEIPNDTSPELKGLILRMLAGKPKRRCSYQDILDHQFLQKGKETLRLSSQIGSYHYFQGEFLGHGSFGIVFKGGNAHTSGTVAVKRVDLDRDVYSAEDLRRESQILMQLKHSGIVEFLYFFEDSRYMYLIMEYCNGGSLNGYFRHFEGEKLSEVITVPLLSQILSSLQYLHRRGVIHRDLKPENILINHESIMPVESKKIVTKLADFGVARYLTPAGKAATTLCGTPQYMAPEIITESPEYGFKVDIWSVGVVLYRCLIGRVPYPYQPQGHPLMDLYRLYSQNKRLEPTIPDSVSPRLIELIIRTMKVDPEERLTLDDVVEFVNQMESGN